MERKSILSIQILFFVWEDLEVSSSRELNTFHRGIESPLRATCRTGLKGINRVDPLILFQISYCSEFWLSTRSNRIFYRLSIKFNSSFEDLWFFRKWLSFLWQNHRIIYQDCLFRYLSFICTILIKNCIIIA